MVEELAVIKHVASKEWDQAEAKLTTSPVSRRDSLNFAFYQGQIAYHRGNWQTASEHFEKVLLKQNPQNRLTPRQMSELLMGYVDSLYNLKDVQRFKSVVKALYQDIAQSKSAPILNVAERVHYLLTESLVAEQTPDWKEVETLAREFRGKFQKSPYSGRIEYLLGLSLLRDGRLKEGKDVLNALLGKKDVPGYVREMARTELSSLELRTKQL
jgi:tetratricopeptide (TPR) repeat protein